MRMNGRIFVALDGLGKAGACELVAKLTSLSNPYAGAIAGFKIHDLWDQEGPKILNDLECAGAGGNVWVDLKLHDVPQTVRLRARAVKNAKAGYVTVHASGGIEMMRAAVDTGISVFAITVLTSLTEEETHLLCGQPAKAAVLQRARMARLAGVWGVVCSAHEVGILAKQPELGGLQLVVPGIRLAGKDATDDNQKRVNTPAAAFAAGATHIVVGSELTKAEDPVVVLDRIVCEIAEVSDKKGVSAQ